MNDEDIKRAIFKGKLLIIGMAALAVLIALKWRFS
jgi:LPS O-antigen subunit length determinant protein (WzzB/FepE family)